MYELTVLASLCAYISILSFKEIGTLNVRFIVGSFSFIYNHSLVVFLSTNKLIIHLCIISSVVGYNTNDFTRHT